MMPHPFHEYLASQVRDRPKSRRVVVWHDKEGLFQPFIDEQAAGGLWSHGATTPGRPPWLPNPIRIGLMIGFNRS